MAWFHELRPPVRSMQFPEATGIPTQPGSLSESMHTVRVVKLPVTQLNELVTSLKAGKKSASPGKKDIEPPTQSNWL
jgi:hypothetical protein